MSRRRRKTNAEASTSRASEDRADARDPQTPTEPEADTTEASEGSSSEAEQDAGRPAAEEKQLEKSSTTAGAKVVEAFKPKPAPRKFAQCPKCGHRGNKPELVGKAAVCPNCRTQQTFI
jgi:hypothetical protein